MGVYVQMGGTSMLKLSNLLRYLGFFSLVVLSVLATACEGGTSGSVSGSRERCSHKFHSGQCSGSFKRLSGTYSLDIENDSVVSKAEVEVQAAVETGSLKVYVKTPEDGINSVDIPAGGSATLRGVAKGEWDGFRVYFEAVEGQAEGVTYEISYQVP
jgi:hypothetical protein